MSSNIADTPDHIRTPPARLVGGSLYKPNDKDAEGRPLRYKSGVDIGKPRVDYYFAVAIAKGAEQSWWQTPWGAKIMAVGAAAFPQAYNVNPKFAWKVTDGDSQIPNTKGKKPCDREGYPGHWVLSVSGGFAPKIFRDKGTTPMPQPDYVKLGHYVEVLIQIQGNGSAQQPGVFLNHRMVNWLAFGPEIYVGPDATAVGFGEAALPPGASAVPLASAMPPAMPGAPAAMPAMPGMPAPAAAMPGMPAPAAAVPAMPAAAPNPAFIAVPGAPATMPVPGAMPMPVPAAGPAMTAKANGFTYAQMIAGGWTHEALAAQGYLA